MGRRKNEAIEFPDCWEEVKSDEWLYLMGLRAAMQDRTLKSLDEMKRNWAFFILRSRGMRFAWSGSDKRERQMILVKKCADNLSWAFSEFEQKNAEGNIYTVTDINFNSTVNLMPEIKGKWFNLYGPKNYGQDLTFGEFRHAVAAVRMYEQTKDEMHLLALCAILYRRTEIRDGAMKRREFVPELMDEYIEDCEGTEMTQITAAYFWFAAFCKHLYTEPFVIEGMEVSFAPVFQHTGGGEADGYGEQSIGLNAILFTMAESGVFGNMRETDKTPLLTVMMKLLDDKQRTDKMIREAKKR